MVTQTAPAAVGAIDQMLGLVATARTKRDPAGYLTDVLLDMRWAVTELEDALS